MRRDDLYDLLSPQLSNFDRILVVGDIHGDYKSLETIQKLHEPTRDILLFLGDYADRGTKGIEVIEGVNDLIDAHPNGVIALKGNHEDYTDNGRPKFAPCDLIQEAEDKRGSWNRYFRNSLRPFLQRLYLAVMIPNEILFLHGGVSTKIQETNDLRFASKLIEEDVLWSDPSNGYGEYANMRGAGVEFGKDISEKVCNRLGVKRIIRSHQPQKAWKEPCIEHNGRVITVSSTKIYGGDAFILALPTTKLESVQILRNLTVYL